MKLKQTLRRSGKLGKFLPSKGMYIDFERKGGIGNFPIDIIGKFPKKENLK